jgi:hypothetical protein
MVELLQALAWDIKGDDTISESVKRNGELQNFMMPPDFSRQRANLTPNLQGPHTTHGHRHHC